ncbi:glycosyltransferase [Sporosarcina saromensis]|uniref:Glycosyltransferase n=1 Tax=Sporosarcina saromensis TaxID=359365 RepID=A0ABU4GAP6_9BACL|nr:glycosyltransferase [Sporosarcina saromensis]MDW0114031.1 glycosyltransferase [Sporosarcina saromensis]
MEKTLYLLNYPGIGGTEKYVYDLISHRRPEDCILVYSDEGPGLERFQDLNVKVIRVPMKQPFDLSAAKELKKVIKNEKIKVVHAQFLRENYIAILAKLLGAPVKVIWTYHVDVKMRFHIRAANRIMTRFNTQIIAVSNFMKHKLIQKGIRKSAIQVIYNGVNKPQQVKLEQPQNAIPIIAVIGRLSAEKGHLFLINALEHFKKSNPTLQWQCHIYGDGLLKKQLEQLVVDKNMQEHINFFGHVSPIEKVYLNTDLVVVPSENEALSYVGIEALSYGIPLIGTTVGGIPEVIEEGVTGLLVKYGDIENLSSKLEELLTNKELYQKMSKQGILAFNSKFEMSRMLQKTYHVYDK